MRRGRRGRLRSGNPPGDPNKARRCGARTPSGALCRGLTMRNGRCRMHGGASTGLRTRQGLARMRTARTKHGFYLAETLALRRYLAVLRRHGRALLNTT